MIDRLCWLALIAINGFPVIGFFVPSMLTRLYGIDASSELLILLQHRAALFAVVALPCVWAMIDPGMSRIAVIIAAISMLSFLALYLQGGSPQSLRGIALGDLIGLPFLGYLAWKSFLAG